MRKVDAVSTAQACFFFMWNELEQGRCLRKDGNADIKKLLDAAKAKTDRGYHYSFTHKTVKLVFLMWQHVHVGVPLEQTTFDIGG